MPVLKPSSRQKSCAACAKAKRRCDLQTPQCIRCASKGLDCQYVNEPLTTSTSLQGYDVQGWPPQDGTVVRHSQYRLPSPSSFNLDDAWSIPSLPNMHLPLVEPAIPEVGVLDNDIVKYLVKLIKRYPAMLVYDGKLPFLHQELYREELPRAIQDTYSVCACYLGKTEANQEMIFRIMDAKIVEVLLQPESSWTYVDNLACVQALLMFQIIRLFDGDIRQRALAEKQDTILEQWTDQLRQRTPNESSPFQPSSWKAWIFAESVRRTVILSYFLRGTYANIKLGYCTIIGTLSRLPFTAQTQLWDSPSGTEWQQAAQSLTPSVVSYQDFMDMWEIGRISEIQPFERLLIGAYKGES